MIKKIIASICLLFSLVSFAQQGSSSPYSFYGIGDVRFKGVNENRAMGGLSVLPDSIHLNIQNPAMYSALKLTSFSIGGTFTSNHLKTNDQSEKAQRTTLDYMAVGIPSKKLGIGFGLIPYSSVGYKIRNSIYDTSFRTDNFYTGDGGINKVFLGFGYQLTKQLSIGADAQYNFGKISTTSTTLRFVDANFQSTDPNAGPDYQQIQYGTTESNISYASGVNFNTGLSFKSKLSKTISFFSSATYSPESRLRFRNSRSVALVQANSSGVSSAVGDAVDITVANTKLKLPSKFTFGFGVGDPKKWIVGSEITLQSTSDFGNRFNEITNVSYENAKRFTFGGYYIPNYKSFSNYFDRVVYRGGFRYENTGLVINNKSIEDTALTLGLGFPLRGTFSNLNFLFELGNRGTKDAGLVREHYMNFGIGLSLNERWFQKRKYD